MQQVYHSHAATNINVRSLIHNNLTTNLELASRLNASHQTISKWKNRDFVEDVSSRPHNIKYALSDLEKALAVSRKFGSSTWLPIDEVWESLLEKIPDILRSSVYHCFMKEGINKVPQEKKDKAKKIQSLQIWKFTHRCDLAIDKTTRIIFYYIYEDKSATNTEDFNDRCLGFFPVYITHILTDNGLEFTNRLIKSKKGNL